MSQIIYCDFRRTERRNKMDRILQDIYYIAEVEKQKNPKITEDDLFKMPRVQLLNNIYTDLTIEEEQWKDCKYWR